MKYLSMLFIFMMIACEFATGNDDAQIFLEPQHIKGSWLFITEKPSAIPGLYEKDTVIYRIGIDPMPDIGAIYLNDPMAFYIQYDKGNSFGYIYDPEETYDFEKEISILEYVLIEGLPGPTTESSVKFSMPYTDSLHIKIGNKLYTTHRER